MTICSISDLHGNLPLYPSYFWEGVENCEVLFICGDISPLYIQRNFTSMKEWLLNDFKPWAENLPFEKIFFIAGNHDIIISRLHSRMFEMFPMSDKVTYLENTGATYVSSQDSKTYEIFGTPYCHIFGNWAFMLSDERLSEIYKKIPEKVDILITHDAPYGTSDICFEGFNKNHIGNIPLRDAIIKQKPRYNFHGHLHTSNHELEILEDCKVYNTSILNEQYDIVYLPLIIKL